MKGGPCLNSKVELGVVVVDLVGRAVDAWRRYESRIGGRSGAAGAGQVAVEVSVGCNCAICTDTIQHISERAFCRRLPTGKVGAA
jgi:hypothetical protein